MREVLRRYEKSNPQILFQTIETMIYEQLKKIEEREHFWMDTDKYVIMLSFSQEASLLKRNEITNIILQQLSYGLEMILNVDSAIAAGRNMYPIEEVNKSYQELEMLLDQKFFYPEKKIFKKEMFLVRADSERLEDELERAVNAEERLDDTFKRWVEEEKKNGAWFSIGLLKEKILHMIYLCNLKYNTEWKEELGNVQDICEMSEKICLCDMKIKEEKEIGTYSYPIAQAVKIINEELKNDIMQEEIAERVGMSTSYFSRMFSKEMKQSFSSYVIEKRVEKAKKLIITTNLKQYEIAEMCGFHSSVHFNNMFKKIYGVTPNQFRSKKA